MKHSIYSRILCLLLALSCCSSWAWATDEIEASGVEALPETAPIMETMEEDGDPMEFKVTHPQEWAEFADMTPWRQEGITAPTLEAGETVSFDSFRTRPLRTGETLLRGIDVSEHQSNIDWAKVAASGVDFAVIRVGFRGYGVAGRLMQDDDYVKNITQAKENGLLVGVYIFSQAITEAEGREEAKYLIDLIRDYDIDLPLVLDYEYAGNYGRLYNAKLSRQAATDVCNAFCREAENSGYEAMVYANPSMLDKQLYREQLGRLWLAHYITETDYDGDYEYWQCTSSGTVPGIEGRVDLDFWFRPGADSQPSRPTMSFTDVSEDSWYYSVVREAYGLGVVKGNGDATFAPNGQVTRGQLVTMLYRMEDSPAVSGETDFRDLTQDWYQDAVVWAWKGGVVNGYSETEFGPEDPITRQDLVTILYRAAGRPAVSGQRLQDFRDQGDISGYARDAMEWAAETGIMNGDDRKQLHPQDHTTRAEACALLMRYRDL